MLIPKVLFERKQLQREVCWKIKLLSGLATTSITATEFHGGRSGTSLSGLVALAGSLPVGSSVATVTTLTSWPKSNFIKMKTVKKLFSLYTGINRCKKNLVKY